MRTKPLLNGVAACVRTLDAGSGRAVRAKPSHRSPLQGTRIARSLYESVLRSV